MEDQEFLNRLWFIGDNKTVKKIKKSIKGTDETDKTRQIHIDFNKIIPMPAELDIESDNAVALATIFSLHTQETGIPKLNKHPLELNKEEFNLYLSYIKNVYNYKHMNWLSWRSLKWNSAWNAYDTKEKDNYIQFKTQHSPSLNITLALSRQFKTIEFIHGWVDRETGSPGKFIFKDGSASPANFENSYESSAFATNLLEDK